MKLSGAKIVIEQLILNGVTDVFGYPGGAVLSLYDELYKNSDRINHILTAHEQGAAHAADGYARVSGKTGVVIATSGPGATNLVTGIANAYLDSIPLVAITGNVTVPLLGRDSFQEVDIVGITQPIVKHSFIVRSIEELEYTLSEAFRIAGSGRKGPVLVDIPKNIQTEMYEYKGICGKKTENTSEFDFDVENVVKIIKESKKPYIYAGGGIIAANAEAELKTLSERISAPVGLSMMGLTALNNNYPLNLGMSGMHGKYAASLSQSECDVMIVLGARFSDRATGNVHIYKENKTIIHVDIDCSEHGKNVSADLDICCDVKVFLTALLEKLPKMENRKWLTRIEELKQIEKEDKDDSFTPKNIIELVRKFCDDDTIVATDVGQHQMWTTLYYKFGKPRTLLTSGGLGTMGFGLGAAIGGSVAKNRHKTVLFTGDGSFGMNLNELATAVSQNLPITVVVLNNNSLGLPRQWQTMFYGKRYSHSTLNRKTDFSALAKAFGADGYSAENLSELEKALENIGSSPAVIDCRIDIDEKVFPMIPPGGSVKDIVIRG